MPVVRAKAVKVIFLVAIPAAALPLPTSWFIQRKSLPHKPLPIFPP
jgi:hypothetical protein